MKTKSILTVADFGNDALFQAAEGDNGSGNGGPRRKEHIWHEKVVHMVGPYGEDDVTVECLYCTDEKYWAYVIGDVDEYGYGYADFDGDGYPDRHPDDNGYTYGNGYYYNDSDGNYKGDSEGKDGEETGKGTDKTSIPGVKQVNDNTCYAACVTYLHNFFGLDVTQEQIIKVLSEGGKIDVMKYGINPLNIPILTEAFFNSKKISNINKSIKEGNIVLANWGEEHVVVVVDHTESGGFMCMDPTKGTYVERNPPLDNFVGSQFAIEIKGIRKPENSDKPENHY